MDNNPAMQWNSIGQSDPNHIHSGWRDFDGDFGRDMLREHLAVVVH